MPHLPPITQLTARARDGASGSPDNRVIRKDRESEPHARSMDTAELQPWLAARFFATSTERSTHSPPPTGTSKGFVVLGRGGESLLWKGPSSGQAHLHVGDDPAQAEDARSGARSAAREQADAPSRRRGRQSLRAHPPVVDESSPQPPGREAVSKDYRQSGLAMVGAECWLRELTTSRPQEEETPWTRTASISSCASS